MRLNEAKSSLLDALKLARECQRELAEKDLSPNALRERFELVATREPFQRLAAGLVNLLKQVFPVKGASWHRAKAPVLMRGSRRRRGGAGSPDVHAP